MTKPKKLDDQLLLHNLSNDGWTNLLNWFEKIIDEFCKEQEIEEWTSFEEIKQRFQDDFHESFLCTIPTLLFKFLIDKGVAHIVDPRPLIAIPFYTDSHKCKRVSKIN